MVRLSDTEEWIDSSPALSPWEPQGLDIFPRIDEATTKLDTAADSIWHDVDPWENPLQPGRALDDMPAPNYWDEPTYNEDDGDFGPNWDEMLLSERNTIEDLIWGPAREILDVQRENWVNSMLFSRLDLDPRNPDDASLVALWDNNPAMAMGMEIKRNSGRYSGLEELGYTPGPDDENFQYWLYDQAIQNADPLALGQELLDKQGEFYRDLFGHVMSGRGEELAKSFRLDLLSEEDKDKLDRIEREHQWGFMDDEEYDQKVSDILDWKRVAPDDLARLSDAYKRSDLASGEAQEFLFMRGGEDESYLRGAMMNDPKVAKEAKKDPVSFLSEYYTEFSANELRDQFGFSEDLTNAIAAARGGDFEKSYGSATRGAPNPISLYLTEALKSVLPADPVSDPLASLAGQLAIFAVPGVGAAMKATESRSDTDIGNPLFWAETADAVASSVLISGAGARAERALVGKVAGPGTESATLTLSRADLSDDAITAALRGEGWRATGQTAFGVSDDVVSDVAIEMVRRTRPAAAQFGLEVAAAAGVNVAEDVPLTALVLSLSGIQPGSQEFEDAMKATLAFDAAAGFALPVANLGTARVKPEIASFAGTYAVDRFILGGDHEEAAYAAIGVAGLTALARNHMVADAVHSKASAAAAKAGAWWPSVEANFDGITRRFNFGAEQEPPVVFARPATANEVMLTAGINPVALKDPNVRDVYATVAAAAMGYMTGDTEEDRLARALLLGGTYAAGSVGARTLGSVYRKPKPIDLRFEEELLGLPTWESIPQHLPVHARFANTLRKLAHPFGVNQTAVNHEMTFHATGMLKEWWARAQDQANVIAPKVESIVAKNFKTDADGRVLINGAPLPVLDRAYLPDDTPTVVQSGMGATLADIADRMPLYKSILTLDEYKALTQVRRLLQPVETLARNTGVVFETRPGRVKGGFYIPRGFAARTEAGQVIEEPGAVYTTSPKKGTKAGFQKHATYESQAEALDAAHQYPSVRDAVHSYVDAALKQTGTAHFAGFLRNLTDDNGDLVFQPPSARMPEELRDAYEALKYEVEKVKGKLQTATNRTQRWDAAAARSGGRQTRVEDRILQIEARLTDKTTTAQEKLALADEALEIQKQQMREAAGELRRTARREGAANTTANQKFRELEASARKLDTIARKAKSAAGLGEVSEPSMGVRLPEVQGPAADAYVSSVMSGIREAQNAIRQQGAIPAVEAEITRAGAKDARIKADRELGIEQNAAVRAGFEVGQAHNPMEMRRLEGQIRELEVQLTEARNRAQTDANKQGKWTQRVNDLSTELQGLKEKLAQVEPKYRDALAAAQNVPPQNKADIIQLQSYWAPADVVGSVNKLLKGRVNEDTLSAFDEVQNFLRTIKASTDASWMGITGLLQAYRDPVAVSKALAFATAHMNDPLAHAKLIETFDQRAMQNGRLTASQWAGAGVHQSGMTHIGEIATSRQHLGPKTLTERGADVPIVKQTNALYSLMGDYMRLEAADAMYQGISAAGGRMDRAMIEEIGKSVNSATGYSRTSFGDIGAGTGGISKRMLFAGRFFQSQISLVANAIGNPGLQGAQARESLLRMIGVGAFITTAANMALGEETTYDPGDPNFMRIRVADRDISLFGPWDSLVKGIISTANGIPYVEKATPGRDDSDPFYMARSKAAPLISMVMDAVQTAAGGTPLSGRSDTWQYWMRQFQPFSIATIGKEAAAASRGGISGEEALSLGVGTVASLLGLKAPPVTGYENYNRTLEEQGVDTHDPLALTRWRNANPDLVPKPTSKEGKQYATKRQSYIEQQLATERAFMEGTDPNLRYVTQWKSRQRADADAYQQWKEATGAGTFEGQKPTIANDGKPKEEWVDSYFNLFDQAEVAGQIDWDKYDKLYGEWLAKNGREAADYVVEFKKELRGDSEVYREYTDSMYALTHLRIKDPNGNTREVSYFELPKFKQGVMTSGTPDEELVRLNNAVVEKRRNDKKERSYTFDDSVRHVLNSMGIADGRIIRDVQRVQDDSARNPDFEYVKEHYPYYLGWFDSNATWGDMNDKKDLQDEVLRGR